MAKSRLSTGIDLIFTVSKFSGTFPYNDNMSFSLKFLTISLFYLVILCFPFILWFVKLHKYSAIYSATQGGFFSNIIIISKIILVSHLAIKPLFIRTKFKKILKNFEKIDNILIYNVSSRQYTARLIISTIGITSFLLITNLYLTPNSDFHFNGIVVTIYCLYIFSSLVLTQFCVLIKECNLRLNYINGYIKKNNSRNILSSLIMYDTSMNNLNLINELYAWNIILYVSEAIVEILILLNLVFEYFQNDFNDIRNNLRNLYAIFVPLLRSFQIWFIIFSCSSTKSKVCQFITF